MRAAPTTCAESAENDANAANVDATSAEASSSSSQPTAFAQYRFVEEDGRAVLYIYELQLAPAARRKGVGKFLTQVTHSVPSRPTLRVCAGDFLLLAQGE
jgi:ribosomal protein S18 acetylase RimI-like enzyme